jgi:hypothetical protein
MQRAREKFERDHQLLRLAQTDPMRYHAEVQRMERERLARRDRVQKSLADREQREAQEQHQRQERDRVMRQEFEAVGVPFGQDTFAMAQAIYQRYREADIRLQPNELAAEVRKQWRAERGKWMRSIPREDLLEYLGDDLRSWLREHEATTVKEQRRQERAVVREERDERPAQRQPAKGMTDVEFRRKYGA